MILYKHCDKRYNPLNGGKSLRFGTLIDYQAIENDELRDETEGQQYYTFTFDNDVFDSESEKEAISALAFNDYHKPKFFPPGHYMNFIPHMGVNNGVLAGSSHLFFQYRNCYIFSLTSKSDYSGFSYDSAWALDFSDITPVLRAVCDAINDERNRGAFKPRVHGAEHIAWEGNFQYRIDLYRVEYDKRVQHWGKSDRHPMQDIGRLLCRAPYSKPPEFSEEVEFRLIVKLHREDGRALVAPKEPLYISVDRLMPFVRPV